MSDAAKGLSAEDHNDFREFQILYRDWLTARAACDDPDAPEDDEDAAVCERKRDAVERALLAMPAPNPGCFFEKWEVLAHLVASDAEHGRLTNHRTTWALAAVKADLLRFGLKHLDLG
jgi:hypothetical protein